MRQPSESGMPCLIIFSNIFTKYTLQIYSKCSRAAAAMAGDLCDRLRRNSRRRCRDHGKQPNLHDLFLLPETQRSNMPKVPLLAALLSGRAQKSARLWAVCLFVYL